MTKDLPEYVLPLICVFFYSLWCVLSADEGVIFGTMFAFVSW